MLKNLVLLYISLYSLTVWAVNNAETAPTDDTLNDISEQADEVPPNRSSSASLVTSFGSESYRSNSLSGNFGVNKDWQINAHYLGQKSESITTASQFDLGANVDASQTWNLNFGITVRREPDEVSGLGLNLGANYLLSELWDGDLDTELTIDAQFLRYSQSRVAKKRKSKIKETSVPMNSLTLTLDQQLSKVVRLKFSVTQYEYGGSSAEEVSNAISNRPNVSAGLMQLVNGLPVRAVSMGASFRVSKFSFAPSVSRSLYSFDTTVNGVSLQNDFNLDEHWGFNLDLSTSKSDSGTKNNLLAIGATYYW